MSKQKHTARHASKQSSSLARVTTTVAVTGGLVAGIAVAESAGASSVGSAKSSAAAASQPLQLKTITPAKSLRVAAAAPAAATHKRTAPVQVSRSLARTALTAPRAKQAASTAAPVVTTTAAAPAPVRHHVVAHHEAGAQRHHRRAQVHTVHHVQVRRAVTQRAATYASAARTVEAPSRPAAPAPSGSHSSVLAIASGLTGIPYVWGGGTPAGFDCSGFVSYVYAQIGIQLPHQSGEIRAMATPVSDPQPGDLVFLPGHVAIYAGNGMVYEAHHPGTPSGLYPLLPGSTFGRV